MVKANTKIMMDTIRMTEITIGITGALMIEEDEEVGEVVEEEEDIGTISMMIMEMKKRSMIQIMIGMQGNQQEEVIEAVEEVEVDTEMIMTITKIDNMIGIIQMIEIVDQEIITKMKTDLIQRKQMTMVVKMIKEL